MRLFFAAFFLACFVSFVSADNPKPFAGYELKPLDASVDLLTGLLNTPDGIIACDRGQGALLQLSSNRSVQKIIENLDTPVDVSLWDNQWLVLQEEAGSLISVDVESKNRKPIASGFLHPSAFALDNEDNAYITEFETGFLFRVNLKTGEVDQIDVFFDKPADVLFVAPNRLIVADQVALDGRSGAIYTLNTQGAILNVDRRVVDPTGLAVSNSGELYCTSFFIQQHQMGHESNNDKGGVLQIRAFRRPEVIIDNLIGPTSLLFEPDGSLVVLEEPTDSIYRYSQSGQRTTILGGFASIHQAVRNKAGNIIAIESGQCERLRTEYEDGTLQTWAEPEYGNWKKATLATDGLGNVYLSEPFLSHIHVFDSAGNLTNTFQGIVPYYTAGIPTGGLYAFTQSGNSTFMTRLKIGADPKTIRFDLTSQISACLVQEDGNLILATISGEIGLYSPNGNKLVSILEDHPGYNFTSIVSDDLSKQDIWLYEENQKEIFYLKNESTLQPVAQAFENGVLLPDSDGAMFLSESGKRFVITPSQTKVKDWLLY